MCNSGGNGFSTEFFQCFSTFNQGSSRIYDIIDNNTVFTCHITDEIHNFSHTWFRAFFLNDCNRCTNAVSQITSSCNTAKVRRYNDNIFHIFFINIFSQNRCAKQMIYRHIKETLNLACMQINCYKTCNTCRLHQISY